MLEAKKKSPKNCEYFLADILQNPLGKKKFDLIVALNMFELVEPSLLLKTISKQISNGFIFLTDPYDYDRGRNSVKNPLDENQIRDILLQNKFQITSTTKTPSKINWNLKINTRTKLNYKVDIIIARKIFLKFNMQSPGFEPGSLTWQARIITKLYYDCSNV